MDVLALVRKAADQGVDIVPVSHFSIEPMIREGILLGYSEYSVEQIQDGMRRLGMAMASI
jgi:GntR family transcriptional regulator/MocR family aminotransferase